MSSQAPVHLTDEQLARYQDGKLPQREAAHLGSCSYCRSRLQELEAGVKAYAEYCDAVRGPTLPAVPKPWLRLSALIALHEVETSEKKFSWWPAAVTAALCATAVVAVLIWNRSTERPSARATELLRRSARSTPREGRRISMRLHGRTWVRPAVLNVESSEQASAELVRLRTVFVAANYSWREPLSAASFQDWRSGLRDGHDSVTVVQGPGEKQSYRVQTENAENALRSASLTLRAKDLHPTNGVFQFTGEDTLELAEEPDPVTEPLKRPTVSVNSPPVETPATPEDTLHVLAALNQIGADVGEPIEISEDAGHRHVVVRGGGLSAARQQQLAQALKPLAHVVLDFDSVRSVSHSTQPSSREKHTSAPPGPLRQKLEDQIGGAIAFQETTDRVLDASSSILARTHSVEVLAEKFPPEIEEHFVAQDRELLHILYRRHVIELTGLISRIGTDLKPLLERPTISPPSPSANTNMGSFSQSDARALLVSAQELDRSLNLLLAGDYARGAGEELLRELPSQIERVAAIVQTRTRAGGK